MKSESELSVAVDKYADTIKRICFLYLKSDSDTQDVFQIVFLKYYQLENEFESEDKERAWFMATTIKQCKDPIKRFFVKRILSIDTYIESVIETPDMNKDFFEALLSLPDKYKDVIYLFYYEHYSALEIAELLKKKENTIYTRLSRGKEILSKKLGGDFDERIF